MGSRVSRLTVELVRLERALVGDAGAVNVVRSGDASGVRGRYRLVSPI